VKAGPAHSLRDSCPVAFRGPVRGRRRPKHGPTRSENAGAHQELGDHAVTAYPYDIRQQADALYAALTMPVEERREKLRACAAIVERNDIAAWFSAQLADLAAVAPRSGDR
jgi:trehalose-6-phosphate synthase